jgi:hypothetical protein
VWLRCNGVVAGAWEVTSVARHPGTRFPGGGAGPRLLVTADSQGLVSHVGRRVLPKRGWLKAVLLGAVLAPMRRALL